MFEAFTNALLDKALEEAHRILREGGRVVCDSHMAAH
jgi:ubiquinone/menaquinone biosynthesis C-methylase UbiE